MELIAGTKVIIDLSWLMYRSFYTFPHFSFIDSSGKHVHTGTIFGVLRQHLAIMEEFPNASYHYGIEPETNHRYQIDPSYKAGRSHSVESQASTYGMLTKIISMLKLFPRTYVWTAVSGESDDVIYTLALRDPTESHVYSADNDLLVLLASGVLIFRSLKKGEIGYLSEFYIKEKFGMEVPADAIPLYKVVRGDSSDNIPVAVERFPTKLLEIALRSCKTVDQLLESARNGILAEPRLERLLNAEQKLRHNESLIKLEKLDIYEAGYEELPPRYFIVNYGLRAIRKAFPNA